MLALFVGVAIGLLDFAPYLPNFLVTEIEHETLGTLTVEMPPFLFKMMQGAGACQGPVAMLLAGFVIAGYPLKEIFVHKKVYVASLVRLIAIPAAAVLALRAFGASKEIMTLALIYFGTPLGLNSIVYPETYGGDVKTGASMASISHTLCVVTIPLMYWLLIGVL